jgi:hypothetical protein
VTGDVPFHADTPMAVLLKHVTEQIPAAHKLNPDIPREVETIILKAAAKNPQERYQSAEEMAAAMEQALAKITAAREIIPEKKKVKPIPEPKKKEARKSRAEQSPIKPWRPPWHIRPVFLIAGGALLVLVLAGILGTRYLVNRGEPTATADTDLQTWIAYKTDAAPPTQKAATQTNASQFSWMYDLPILVRDQVNVIAVDPNDPQVVYIGTQNSGLSKSTDGAKTWTLNSTGLVGAWVTTLVIDPQAPQTVYAGVQASGVYNSTTQYDGGQANGVYKSTDGGKTWTLSQANMSGLNAKTWPWTRPLQTGCIFQTARLSGKPRMAEVPGLP